MQKADQKRDGFLDSQNAAKTSAISGINQMGIWFTQLGVPNKGAAFSDFLSPQKPQITQLQKCFSMVSSSRYRHENISNVDAMDTKNDLNGTSMQHTSLLNVAIRGFPSIYM